MSKKDFFDGLEKKDIKIDKEFYTAEEAMKDKSAIYIDQGKQEDGIPDLVKLTTELVSFLEYMNTADMEILAETDYDAFVKHLETKFDSFSLNYYTIFKLLTNKEERHNRDASVMKLLGMIQVLQSVQAGEANLEKESELFKESLAEQYIYPQFGGKVGFTKAMLKGKNKTRKSRY